MGDYSLIDIVNGDRKAFEGFFYEHKDRVNTIALTYTANQFIAEEIVQDVFLRVWKNRAKLKDIESISSWLYTITRNLSLTALKKIAKEGLHQQDLVSHLPFIVNDSADRINEYDLKKLIEEALDKLSPQQKKIFELSRLKGYERDQIATLLNIAPATVSVHLTIAIRNVRAFLSNHLDLISIGIILYSNYLHFIFSLTNNN